jgi:hypothetical protein
LALRVAVKINIDVAMVFIVVVAVISAIFVAIMNASGLQAAAPWGLGFAAAYLLFKKPTGSG